MLIADDQRRYVQPIEPFAYSFAWIDDPSG
jgi:hypothetical protein